MAWDTMGRRVSLVRFILFTIGCVSWLVVGGLFGCLFGLDGVRNGREGVR